MSPSPRATARRVGLRTFALLSAVLPLLGAGAASAGSLDALAAPNDADSAMLTLQDLYYRLNDGSAGIKRGTGFAEPASAPTTGTMWTLDAIMAKMPAVDDSNGAAAANVLEGKTFWGLTSGEWGLQTGTVAAGADVTGADGAISFDIPNGLYSGHKTCTATDTDLTADNVKSGIDIFDVTGSYSCTEPTGDATAADVLIGKTFSNADGTDLTGTMPDNEGDNASTGQAYTTGGPIKLTAPTGFYDGDDTVTATEAEVVALDTDLMAGNIASGKDIFGVTGTAVVATGDATAAQVLTGTTFSNASGAGLSGSMANVGQQDITPGASAQTITQGYHDGTGTVAGDADLVGGNIASGKDIFGVTGTAVVATGDATAAQVLTGTTFSNASGAGLSGSMANVGQQDITPGASAQTITQGYHDGTGTVAGDPDLVTGNIRSGVTIFGVSGATNVVNTSEATNPVVTARMKTGDVAFVNGTKVTGSGTQTLSDASTTVNEGYYAATNLVTVDTDLTADNIKKDTAIFGVTGTYEGGGGAPAPVEKTGQTPTVPLNPAPAGSDGALQKGVAWPNPRFTDNGNGTVTDNLTGLIWLKNANCFGTRIWATALNDANTLNSGECGLTDGSAEGNWRLPNIKELQSLVDFGRSGPALPSGHPFSGVLSSYYWSSSSGADGTSNAWYLNLSIGYVYNDDKSDDDVVWPVRGGQ